MANETPPELTLLREWSTWLVGLQTGALGLVSFVAGKSDNTFTFHKSTLLFAIWLFAASIFVATWVLAAMPSLALRIKKSDDFYHMHIFGNVPIPLWVVTAAQHWLFLGGLVSFVASVAAKI